MGQLSNQSGENHSKIMAASELQRGHWWQPAFNLSTFWAMSYFGNFLSNVLFWKLFPVIFLEFFMSEVQRGNCCNAVFNLSTKKDKLWPNFVTNMWHISDKYFDKYLSQICIKYFAYLIFVISFTQAKFS